MPINKPDDLYVLSAIVDSSDDAIISKNLDGIITSWNIAAEKIFGYTANEAIGKHISIIIPEDLLDEETMIINKIKSGERIDHYETTRKNKNGEHINIALTISAIKDNDQNIIGASKIARNVSDQKLVEERQAMLAAIVSSSDDAIISKNLDGIIKTWNYGAQKIFGYTEKEVIGKHISIIIPKERIDEETVIINKIRKGERIDHFETIRLAKDGREVNISLTISPIKNRNGNIIGASKIARDITEKIEIENRRRLLTEKLQELNKYKDEFMAMASHELKTPLTVIRANLQLLEHKMQGDENVNFVNKTLRSVNKLSDLINDLLDVSKIQSGKLELNLSVFDVGVLLKEATDNIQQTTNTHKIVIGNIQEGLLVKADRDKIEQVIINLLTNAIKYSPNSEEAIVSACRDKGRIIVSVKDTGIGIAQEEIPNIFSRFYRVRGLASTFSGSGIGLYISFEIIKHHGGEMWVESEANKGSTFYFALSAVE